MKSQHRERENSSLWLLAWPIVMELLLQYVMGAADTLMISSISDRAASAVGLSNQVLHAVNMLFLFVNAGAGIVLAVRWGSGRKEEAGQVAALAIRLNLVIGIVLGIAILFGKDIILEAMQVPAEVLPDAKIYLGVVGAGTVLVALHTSAAASIRSSGDTRGPMYAAVAMNVVHLSLNYAFIYGVFGIPELGTQGVAISTIVSRTLAVVFSIWLLYRTFPSLFQRLRMNASTLSTFKDICKVGWPITLSNSSYTYVQTVLFSFIASVGVAPLAAFTYMNTIQGLPTMIGSAIGLAVQIRIGQWYGAGRVKESHQSAYAAVWMGWAIMSIIAIALCLFRNSIIGMYTDDPEIASLMMTIFLLYLVLQPLKMTTMGFAQSLYAVGDNKYVTFAGMGSMWILGAGGAYWLGIRLELGLMGIYAALMLDECARGAFAWLRWRSGRYRLKSTIGTASKG
ncbi:MATE family efflux transporter [Cohnella cholangitidis]|nr:MATE family efflux transporter [Cohnella cholangitidis]